MAAAATVVRPTVINGVETDVLWHQSADDPRNRCVVCVPGNPGAAHFYRYFITAVHRAVRVPVLSVSLAGHNVSGSSHRVYDLDEQYEHIANVFNWLHKQGFTSVVCLAHSIGSHICIKIGLFTARQYGWRFASVINQLLQPRVAHNTLALGEDEFNRVPAQHDHQTLQKLGAEGKLALVYTRNDIWATEAQFLDIRQHSPAVPVVFIDKDCSHAFCVFHNQCDTVAEAIAPLVADAFALACPPRDATATASVRSVAMVVRSRL